MPDFIPYSFERQTDEAMRASAKSLFERMNARRSVRDFSSDPVPRALIEFAIKTASTAPSGANRQPWRFVAVSDPVVKQQIRIAAEAEEREFYEGKRSSQAWLNALEPMGTNAEKPFLEIAPWLVVVFEETHRPENEQGVIEKNYYVKESVGIACGLFIAALHEMGLATLTHTPSPMAFLSEILQRPSNEKPYILFPVGYPADDAHVPDLERKPLDQVSIWFE